MAKGIGSKALAAINANVNDFYAERITYQQFSEIQRELWNQIQAAGKRTHAAVLFQMRRGLPVARCLVARGPNPPLAEPDPMASTISGRATKT
jgi:hypothetical protein